MTPISCRPTVTRCRQFHFFLAGGPPLAASVELQADQGAPGSSYIWLIQSPAA